MTEKKQIILGWILVPVGLLIIGGAHKFLENINVVFVLLLLSIPLFFIILLDNIILKRKNKHVPSVFYLFSYFLISVHIYLLVKNMNIFITIFFFIIPLIFYFIKIIRINNKYFLYLFLIPPIIVLSISINNDYYLKKIIPVNDNIYYTYNILYKEINNLNDQINSYFNTTEQYNLIKDNYNNIKKENEVDMNALNTFCNLCDKLQNIDRSGHYDPFQRHCHRFLRPLSLRLNLHSALDDENLKENEATIKNDYFTHLEERYNEVNLFYFEKLENTYVFDSDVFQLLNDRYNNLLNLIEERNNYENKILFFRKPINVYIDLDSKHTMYIPEQDIKQLLDIINYLNN